MDYDFTPEIDALIAEILEEADWVEPYPTFEQMQRDWPGCPELDD